MTREEIHKAYEDALGQTDAFYNQITNAAYNSINRRYLHLPEMPPIVEQGTKPAPIHYTHEPNVLFMHSATIDAFCCAVHRRGYTGAHTYPNHNLTLFGKPVAALNSLAFGEVKAGVIFNG